MRILVLMLICAAGLVRAEEFTGWLADAKCAAAGKAGANGHAACARKCVEGGEAIVLVGEDKKIYKIANQDRVKPHVGYKVALRAKLDGDTLTVEGGRHLE